MLQQLWPTSAREFLNVGHWRLLEDGRILILGMTDESEEMDAIKPPTPGNVRATLHPSGYLLESTERGTLVKLVQKVRCIVWVSARDD